MFLRVLPTLPRWNDFRNIWASAINKQQMFAIAKIYVWITNRALTTGRMSSSEVFLGKGLLKICSKFTEEQPS